MDKSKSQTNHGGWNTDNSENALEKIEITGGEVTINFNFHAKDEEK